MNVTADIKPFSTPFIINPHCERSIVEPSEAQSSYPTRVRLLKHNTAVKSVNEAIQHGNVAKSESLRGDCVLERHGQSREEEGGTSHSEATVLNTEETSVFPYASRYGANTHHPKDESDSGACDDESRLYIVQPTSRYPQSNVVAPKAMPDTQTRHLDKRTERYDMQSLPSSSEHLPYHEPYTRFTAYLPQQHEPPLSCTVAVDQALGPTNQPFPQKRPRETWNLPRPFYPVYNPYGWYGARQPFLDRTGLNHCGPTPMKDFPVHGVEEDGRPSVQKDDITQDKQRRDIGFSSYPTSYETVRKPRQSEREVGPRPYMASTASETIMHEQHRYGGRPAQLRRPQEQGSDYDRQKSTRDHQSHHMQRADADTRQDPQDHSSFASHQGNSQVVAYIDEGRYNGFAEETGNTRPLRYSPVIIDCYSLAKTDTPSKDSATAPEPAKSPGVPSMAFYDDRIHHQSVGRDPHPGFHAHAHSASQLEPVSVEPRGTAESCAQDVQNQHPTQNPSSQSPRARGSWKAETPYGISFCASTDEDRTRSRGGISMDNLQGLLNSAHTPSVQSGSPGEYRSGPHATTCDDTSTSQRPFTEQGDPGPSTPGMTTTLEKHGPAIGSQKDEEETREAVHSTRQSVKRHPYPGDQPLSSKESRRKSPAWIRVSPDINSPTPRDKSVCDKSDVEPDDQSSSDQPDRSPSRIRITAPGGVISVESFSSQEPSSSPARRREEQTAMEWHDGALSDSTNADDAGPSSKTPAEIPDLSVYAKAFNITDIDECDLDESLDGSVDFVAEEHSQTNAEHTSHGICFCSNPFCCGSLSRSRNHYKELLGPTAKEKRFPCRFCGRRFAHLSTLQNHVRVHTGDRPYQCKYCKKSFAQSGVLKTHLRTHTGDKPFQCPFCGRLFAQSTTLTNHLRIHTGHKPFICKYCSKAFSQPSTLGKHEISHTNERPYPCKVCGRAFVQQSTLNNHMRSHTGQKPYKCPFCGRGFAQLSTMDRHLKIHTSYRYKPHQCPYCEKDFSYLSNLTNHLQTHNKPLKMVS